MRFEQVKDICKEITQNTTERQKYKRICKRDLKNVMRKSNRHPKKEILEIREKRREAISEEIMLKNFPGPKRNLNPHRLETTCFHYL